MYQATVNMDFPPVLLIMDQVVVITVSQSPSKSSIKLSVRLCNDEIVLKFDTFLPCKGDDHWRKINFLRLIPEAWWDYIRY